MRDHITIAIRIFVSRPATIRPCPKTAGTTPTSVSLTGISQFHRIAITVHLNPSAGVVGRNRFSLLSRGQPIKYFHPAAFAQRTGKARSSLSSCGAIHLVPHGGCDPTALIVGWYDLRHMVPRRRQPPGDREKRKNAPIHTASVAGG